MTLMFSKRIRRFALACLISSSLTGLIGNTHSRSLAAENTASATSNIVQSDTMDWMEQNTCNYDPTAIARVETLAAEPSPIEAKAWYGNLDADVSTSSNQRRVVARRLGSDCLCESRRVV